MANLSNINNKFLVTTGGNVLIGQTGIVGSSILQVTGNSTFAGNVTLNGEIYGRTSAAYPGLGGLGFYSLVPYLENANQGGLKIQVQAGASLVDSLTLDSSQNATFAGNVTAGAFLTSNGSFTQNGFWGTTINAGSGSFADFALLNSATAGIMYNPTGTLNMVFQGNVGIGYAAQSNIRTFVYDNSTNYSLAVQQDGSGIPFQVTSGGNIRLIVANNGNVGIGVTGPSSKLQVDGTTSFYNGGPTDGAINPGQVESISTGFNLAGSASIDISTISVTTDKWKVLLTGGFANNYEGGGLVSPSLEIEVDYNSPTVAIGSTGITFSRNATTGKLQVTNTNASYRATFVGTIKIINYPQSALPVVSKVILGRVGIGTDSPQQLLHINEALNTANPGIQVQGGSFGFTLNKAPQSADYVHLKPLGSGISVLRVMPNTSSSTSFIEAWGTDYEADTVNWNRLYMNVAGSSGNATITTDSNGTGAVGNLYLGTNSNQQTLTILDSGNVGIGETSPSEKLEVSGRIKIISTGAAHLILNGDTNNSGDAGEQDAIIDFLGDGDPGLYGFRINSENYGGQTAMNFQEYLNGSYSSRLYIDKVGNVGIGTTSPDAKLTVDSTTAPQLLLTNTGGGNSQILMYDNSRGTQNASITFDQTGENQLYITTGYDSPSDLNRIYFQPGGETAMTIRGGNNATGTAGNVGIGNTTPQTTLHVGTTTTVTNQFTNQVAASNFFVNGNANGGASFFQCKTAAVNINMMGNNDFACNQFTFYHKPLSTSQNVVGSITTFSSSTQYSTTSDYRLKENIIPLSDSITRLKQLKPSRFNFIEDPERTMDGFLAHEVQNIVPEAVNGEKDAIDENGNEVHQGIDQAKLVPLLVAAIQELEARVKELENK